MSEFPLQGPQTLDASDGLLVFSPASVIGRCHTRGVSGPYRASQNVVGVIDDYLWYLPSHARKSRTLPPQGGRWPWRFPTGARRGDGEEEGEEEGSLPSRSEDGKCNRLFTRSGEAAAFAIPGYSVSGSYKHPWAPSDVLPAWRNHTMYRQSNLSTGLPIVRCPSRVGRPADVSGASCD